MQNAAQAYTKVARQIVNPRELEADLLLKAASRLQAIVDAWDRKGSELDAALLYNRKLWSIFMASATSADHALPVAIRSEHRQSRPVRHEPDPVDDGQSQARAAQSAYQHQSRARRRAARPRVGRRATAC